MSNQSFSSHVESPASKSTLRIQVMSDLHLDYHHDYMPPIVRDADVLVLAGDIGSAVPRSRILSRDFGLTRFSPKLNGSPWPRVLFVPGNHEYDELEYDDAQKWMKDLCAELGIEWLEREVVVINGVRFVGSTLWSDFDALAALQPTKELAEKARLEAREAGNKFLAKATMYRDGLPVMADGYRKLAIYSQLSLQDVLFQPFDGKTVAITHFAPTLKSADPRYGVTPSTAMFCNSLDYLLPMADLWIHGHLHCFHDYLVPGKRNGHERICRVIANPRGYFANGEHATFKPEFVIEL